MLSRLRYHVMVISGYFVLWLFNPAGIGLSRTGTRLSQRYDVVTSLCGSIPFGKMLIEPIILDNGLIFAQYFSGDKQYKEAVKKCKDEYKELYSSRLIVKNSKNNKPIAWLMDQLTLGTNAFPNTPAASVAFISHHQGNNNRNKEPKNGSEDNDNNSTSDDGGGKGNISLAIGEDTNTNENAIAPEGKRRSGSLFNARVTKIKYLRCVRR